MECPIVHISKRFFEKVRRKVIKMNMQLNSFCIRRIPKNTFKMRNMRFYSNLLRCEN